MDVRKFSITDASFERSPGQDGEVFAGNVIDQRHGGPITLGYGRYGPHQSINEILAVHDVMVVLEGTLSVTSKTGTVSDTGFHADQAGVHVGQTLLDLPAGELLAQDDGTAGIQANQVEGGLADVDAKGGNVLKRSFRHGSSPRAGRP
jgi:hypothetical protein